MPFKCLSRKLVRRGVFTMLCVGFLRRNQCTCYLRKHSILFCCCYFLSSRTIFQYDANKECHILKQNKTQNKKQRLKLNFSNQIERNVLYLGFRKLVHLFYSWNLTSRKIPWCISILVKWHYEKQREKVRVHGGGLMEIEWWREPTTV